MQVPMGRVWQIQDWRQNDVCCFSRNRTYANRKRKEKKKERNMPRLLFCCTQYVHLPQDRFVAWEQNKTNQTALLFRGSERKKARVSTSDDRCDSPPPPRTAWNAYIYKVGRGGGEAWYLFINQTNPAAQTARHPSVYLSIYLSIIDLSIYPFAAIWFNFYLLPLSYRLPQINCVRA